MVAMRSVLFGLLAVLVAGCAYSPQQITVRPVLSDDGAAYGLGRPVDVRAEDARKDKVLGTRGGIYEKTSTISLANDLAEAIARSARSQLAAKGFQVNSRDPDQVVLRIVVDELVYDTAGEGVGHNVELRAVLRAEASRGGETFSGRYQSRHQQRFAYAPNAERNEQLVNDLLAQTLERMFADEKLRAFLTAL